MNNKPTYLILSNGGAGRLWKVEYRNITSQLEALAQANRDQIQYGGQWIVAKVEGTN